MVIGKRGQRHAFMHAVYRVDAETVDDGKSALLRIDIGPSRKWFLGRGPGTSNLSGNRPRRLIFGNIIGLELRHKYL